MNSNIPYINIHTHAQNLLDDKDIVQVCSLLIKEFEATVLPPGIKFTVGLHPWNIEGTSVERAINVINKAAILPGFFGVGEIGLDRAIDAPLTVQEVVFEQQLVLAEKLRASVVLHNVRAVPEILKIYKTNKCTVPLIFHGFRGKVAAAQQILQVDSAYLSLGAALLTDENLPLLLKEIPLNRMFLETDAASTDIKAIYTKAASVLNMPLQQLKSIIYTNFTNLQEWRK